MSKKLKIKDLVTIGSFAVLYLVISFIVAFLGIIPKLIFIIPPVMALVAGVIVMLFMAKVPKPWALFIFGLITPLFMWAMGHTYIAPIVAIVFIALAEFIFRKAAYKSFKYNMIAYSVFSCWMMGALVQMILLKDKYFKLQTNAGMSDETVNELISLISWQTIIIIFIVTFISGMLGALIGKKMLKKHFQKAGIV